MSDRPDPFVGPTPSRRGQHPVVQDRRSARSLTAAIVAGGLALSASLYPAPDEVPFFGSFPALGIDRAIGLPVLAEPISIMRTAENRQLDVHDLLQLARMLVAQPRVVPTGAVPTPADAAAWNQLLDGADLPAAAPVDFGGLYAMLFVTGGGGGGGAVTVDPAALPDWLLYLNFLLGRLPVRILQELSVVLQRMLPAPPPSVVTEPQILAVPTVPVPLPPETVPAPAPAQSVAPPAPDQPGPVTPATVAPPPAPVPPPVPVPTQVEIPAAPTPPAAPEPADGAPPVIPEREPSVIPAEPDHTVGPASPSSEPENEEGHEHALPDIDDETSVDGTSPSGTADTGAGSNSPAAGGTDAPSGGIDNPSTGNSASG